MSILKWLDRHFEFGVLGLLLAVLTFFSFTNVVMRYLFNSGITWSDEVCRYALVLSGIYSVPCWIRCRTGIRVDAAVALMPKPVRRVLDYIANVLLTGFFCYLLYGTWGVIQSALKVNQLSPALRFPLAYLYMLVGFGFLLAVVRLVQVIILQAVADLEKKGGRGA